MQVNFYRTSVLHLSLEDYHNAGLTNEQTKEIIEKIPDPGMTSGYNFKLRCTPQGINGNWNVHTSLHDFEEICDLVTYIEYHLDRAVNPETVWPEALTHWED